MSKTAYLLAAMLLFAVGCQKSITAKDFEGKWAGKASMSDADLTKLVKSMGGKDSDVAQAKQMFANIKVELELKPDKSYTMGQGQGNMEGTWAFDTMKVTLTPTKIAGQTKDEILKKFPNAKSQFDPLVLTSDKEGKSLTGNAPGQPGQPAATLNFTRGEEAASKKS